MSWTAKIVSKDYKNGTLFVGVEYTDTMSTFSESIDLTGGSIDVLNQKIQGRLNTLTVTEKATTDVDGAVAQKLQIDYVPMEATPFK